MNNQFDTNDWQVPGGEVSAQQAVQSFTDILGNSTLIETGFIVLEHDLFPQEVELGVGYFLPAAQSFQPKLTLKPIGACQGWPETNMYLETTTNTTFPYPDSACREPGDDDGECACDGGVECEREGATIVRMLLPA